MYHVAANVIRYAIFARDRKTRQLTLCRTIELGRATVLRKNVAGTRNSVAGTRENTCSAARQLTRGELPVKPGRSGHNRRSSILSGRSCALVTFYRPFAQPLVFPISAYSPTGLIMLNALSRAALGALKAGKSNLTPKIVQNELPKAMVATTSTCEYNSLSAMLACRARSCYRENGLNAVTGRAIGPIVSPTSVTMK